MYLSTALFALVAAATVTAANSVRARRPQLPIIQEKPKNYPTPAEGTFAGIGTFAHLPYVEALKNESVTYDIAILGAPFDTLVSYRPGTRFGPAALRDLSRRTTLAGGYNVPQKVNPFTSWATIYDVGDIFMTPYDNEFAIRQLQMGYQDLLHRTPASIDYGSFPRIVTLGGDHTITLPILRALNSAYGPVSVIHFDSHLDTWTPQVFKGAKSDVAGLNHGTYFWHATKEGLIEQGASIHAGIRTTLRGPEDYEVDEEVGFDIIEAREIDDIGTEGVIERIRDCVGDNLVYLSIDIDTLDPAFAPATGTPESGGWSTRELRRIIRGLEGLNLVGADIVELSPPYDGTGQVTALAAADLVYEILSLMVRFPLIVEQAA